MEVLGGNFFFFIFHSFIDRLSYNFNNRLLIRFTFFIYTHHFFSFHLRIFILGFWHTLNNTFHDTSNGILIIINSILSFLLPLILYILRIMIYHFFIWLMFSIQKRVKSINGLFDLTILTLKFSFNMMNFNITLVFKWSIIQSSFKDRNIYNCFSRGFNLWFTRC